MERRQRIILRSTLKTLKRSNKLKEGANYKMYHILTKEEALQKMIEGNKVRHRYFSEDEYIHIVDSKMLTEDGCRFEDGFEDRNTAEWLTGWCTVI